MVLHGIITYFGIKLVQHVLNTYNTQDSQSGSEYTRPPPTAPPQASVVTESSSEIGKSKYISGIVKDGYFYNNGKVLNLQNITIINICVCPLSETTDKPYSGKINVMSEKGSILKQEYNERVRWITLSGSGLDVTNATIKVKVKTGQAVPLQYTVVFTEQQTETQGMTV